MELRPGDICRVLARELEAEVPARRATGQVPVVDHLLSSPVLVLGWLSSSGLTRSSSNLDGPARVITASGIGWASIEEIELEK